MKLAALTLLRSRAGVSWLLMVLATATSFGLGLEHAPGASVAVAIFALAVIKVRLIGLDFMELRHAARGLRVVFEVYCVALWAVLSALYSWRP